MSSYYVLLLIIFAQIIILVNDSERKTIDNLFTFVGHDWANQTETNLFTRLDAMKDWFWEDE